MHCIAVVEALNVKDGRQDERTTPCFNFHVAVIIVIEHLSLTFSFFSLA